MQIKFLLWRAKGVLAWGLVPSCLSRSVALQRPRGRCPSPDSLWESQWFSVIRHFPKGLCFKNKITHHVSPGEGKSCGALATASPS